ncbi:AAA family ATPase [Lederbergia citrea]|uniref:AAA family ATPase n=1 Tax=Lederbergia citrea TaxID=2833581 RepID=UPI001BCA421D|nr:SMC family ATPase [Lederbergia citrea]MBS4176919.1 SMC family ATPase [Lederbergia citrea]
MRPIKLMMQAFGPYAGKEMIDFSQLGNRTMFVISGKTGSGKTTIFDGISFAIYGRASGDDRMGTDLRSQFASDEWVTEVSLEFTLRGERYYIWRSPQQEKKKSRGDGYTTINAKAELYTVDEQGERRLLAANVRETDEKIKEIIQLDANQFRQILMIPQGDFRKLLTSDSKEKEGILQRLFRTEQYKRIEEKLKEDANVLKRQVEAGTAERSRVLRNIVTYGNEQMIAALMEEPLNDAHILSLITDILREMYSDLDVLVQSIEEQKQKRDEAKRRVDAAEDILKQMVVRDELTNRKKELQAQENEIETLKTKSEMAQKANKLQHQESLCQRLKKELDDAEMRLDADLKQKKIIDEQLLKAKEKLIYEENRMDVKEKLNSELLQLKNMREDVYSFASRKSGLLKIEKEVLSYRDKIINEKKAFAKKSELSREKEKTLKELRQLQIKVYELEKTITTIENALSHLTILDQSTKKLAEIENQVELKTNELEKVKRVSEDARETLNTIEQHWLKGQAGHIAGTLSDGHPCPVCGSSNHPFPAEQSIDYPTENDLKLAKSAVDKAYVELSEIEGARQKFKAEAEFLQGKIDETLAGTVHYIPSFKIEMKDVYLQSYKKDLAEKKHLLEEYGKEIKQIPALEIEVNEMEKELERREKEIEDLAELERQRSISYSEAAAEVNNLSRLIPNDLKDIKKYDEKVAGIDAEIKKLNKDFETAREFFTKTSEELAVIKGKIDHVKGQVHSANEALTIEREKFIEMLEEEEFASYKHYHESKKTSAEINMMDEAIRAYREEYRSISDRLKDYESRLNMIEKPNMSNLKERLDETEKIYAALLDQHANISLHIKKNEEIVTMVTEINNQIKRMEEDYELIGHLADITRGQNTYRLSFERFVLASFLDDILHAANVRLIKMTSGRYQLLRKTDRSKGNVQSGLELLIFDQYTGQERHVKTLSGGESFKAALSLALGLADVVQEHAGGVSLETMFIDEGFGTLDPESIDHAIEALMDIQSSGRLVGVISHVPELKERIDARLEVIAYQHGSKTEFRFLG